MEHGKLIMLIISCSLLFIIAVPFYIRIIRQLTAIKHGIQYFSDRVSSDNSGRLFVEWTDENGIKHSNIFNVVKRDYLFLPEVTIYSYKKILSLGRMSVLNDFFMIMIDIVAMIYILVYALLNL